MLILGQQRLRWGWGAGIRGWESGVGNYELYILNFFATDAEIFILWNLSIFQIFQFSHFHIFTFN